MMNPEWFILQWAISFQLVSMAKPIHICKINDYWREMEILKQCLNLRLELPYLLFALAKI